MIVCCGLTSAAADALQGRWRIHGGGATLDFVTTAGSDGGIDIVWYDGPDLSIPQGTVIGHAVPGARTGEYDCHISTDPRRPGSASKHAADFRIRLTDGDNMAFEAYRRTRRVSLWRWLPYLFRVTVVSEDNRPADLDGASRVDATPRFIVI